MVKHSARARFVSASVLATWSVSIALAAIMTSATVFVSQTGTFAGQVSATKPSVPGSTVSCKGTVFTEYVVPTPNSYPRFIVAGPDGNMWFTEPKGDKIGRITPAGTITEFPLPEPDAGPYSIAVGPDGNLWFPMMYRKVQSGPYQKTLLSIGKITPAGVITEYADTSYDGYVHAITKGPDNKMWFGGYHKNLVGITPGGAMTFLSAPLGAVGLATGPDGNIWYVAQSSDKVYKTTLSGVTTEYSLPGAEHNIARIIVGSDGNLWALDRITRTDWNPAISHKMLRITTSGIVTAFDIPAGPAEMVLGPDGNIWFTANIAKKIAKITPAGVVTEYAIPGSPGAVMGIAAGLDGSIWYTDEAANKIVKVTFCDSGTDAPATPTHPVVMPVKPVAPGTGRSATVDACPLAGHWPFDSQERSGVVPALAGPPGLLVDPAVTVSADRAPVLSEGGSYSFDGKSRVLVPGAATADAFTLSLWVKPQPNGKTWNTFINFPIAAPGERSPWTSWLGINTADSTHPRLEFWKGVIANKDIPYGKWTHVAVTAGPGGSKLYQDGVLVASGNTPVTPAAGMEIGCTPYMSTDASQQYSWCFKGTMDDVRVYHTALDAEAIAALANGGVPACESGGTVDGIPNRVVEQPLMGEPVNHAGPGSQGTGFWTKVWKPVGNFFSSIGSWLMGGDEVTHSGPGTNRGPEQRSRGNIWFTLPNQKKIGNISASGQTRFFDVHSSPFALTTGPDGNVWFTLSGVSNAIGTISSDGRVRELADAEESQLKGNIVAGPDGALWFTSQIENKIGRATVNGELQYFTIPTQDSGPEDIALGSDSALWFTEINVGKIGRIATDGTIREFETFPGNVYGITAGPDGALWFGSYEKIGRITTSGEVTSYPIASRFQITDIISGPDGALWFAAHTDRDLPSKIGRMTIDGDVTLYTVPLGSGRAEADIAFGNDGALWFTTDSQKIGRMTMDGTITMYPVDGPVWKIAGISAWPGFGQSEDLVIGNDFSDVVSIDLHPTGALKGQAGGGVWEGTVTIVPYQIQATVTCNVDPGIAAVQADCWQTDMPSNTFSIGLTGLPANPSITMNILYMGTQLVFTGTGTPGNGQSTYNYTGTFAATPVTPATGVTGTVTYNQNPPGIVITGTLSGGNGGGGLVPPVQPVNPACVNTGSRCSPGGVPTCCSGPSACQMNVFDGQFYCRNIIPVVPAEPAQPSVCPQVLEHCTSQLNGCIDLIGSACDINLSAPGNPIQEWCAQPIGANGPDFSHAGVSQNPRCQSILQQCGRQYRVCYEMAYGSCTQPEIASAFQDWCAGR